MRWCVPFQDVQVKIITVVSHTECGQCPEGGLQLGLMQPSASATAADEDTHNTEIRIQLRNTRGLCCGLTKSLGYDTQY